MSPEPRGASPWLVAAAALAAGGLMVAGGLSPFLRAVAALILVVLPGYLLAWRFLRPRFGFAGAFGIGGALSIGMIVVAGLVLNLLPWGLQPATWLAYVLVTIGLAFLLDRPRLRVRPVVGMATHEVVLGGIGALLLVGAFVVARTFSADPAESFTVLSMTAAADAPNSTVVVTIRSEENAPTGYRLDLLRDGSTFASWSSIQLASGQSWTKVVLSGSGRIEARLFRLTDSGTVYRHVRVQIIPAAQG